jgi:hypothetical protein
MKGAASTTTEKASLDDNAFLSQSMKYIGMEYARSVTTACTVFTLSVSAVHGRRRGKEEEEGGGGGEGRETRNTGYSRPEFTHYTTSFITQRLMQLKLLEGQPGRLVLRLQLVCTPEGPQIMNGITSTPLLSELLAFIPKLL